MISRSTPTRQVASCQRAGLAEDVEAADVAAHQPPLAERLGHAVDGSSTSHFGAVTYSPIRSMSRFSLTSGSTTQAVKGSDSSTMLNVPLGVTKRIARGGMLPARNRLGMDAPVVGWRFAGSPGSPASACSGS